MKKVLALGLALILVLSLAACGGKKAEAEANPQPKVTDNADEVSDNMTSSDGKYEVAFVTDVGQLKDKSFNQGTYDGVKLYANNNGLSYKYYQPANGDQATDDDRYDAMKSACENGAKVVVAAGFMQGSALERAAKDYPDTKFVFIDGWGMGLDNVVGIAFNEHECGYLAGYAVVKEGYEKLIKAGGVSVIHPDILTCGGALELKKIGDIADENGVAVAIHMAESPIACMAAVQTAAAMHNVLALEYHSVDVPWWSDMVNGLPNPLIENGFIKVPDAPGLGIESLNEELLAQHINPDIPGMWESTDQWNREFSNDRIWS